MSKEFSMSIEPASNQCGEYAVHIRNLCKRYGDGPQIVQNLCMNVRKGTIYGLLGSSGCGKTTVLSFIVGLKKWDSGELLVFGKKPSSKESGIPGKRLGYMPQEIALYDHLSILEVIQFYGRIYNMTNDEIIQKWDFLKKLLQLPKMTSKTIKDLSGGQKRRASLALALIHSPELIVLDEPTVGQDPLLRRTIWNHLNQIVRTLGTTVIITTHYIEEARLASTIGIMRKGRLLMEESPVSLLQRYQCDLLEQVVLQLCRKDETNPNSVVSRNEYQPNNKLAFKSTWNENVSSSVGISNEQHKIMNGMFRRTADSEYDINQYLERINGDTKLENREKPVGKIQKSAKIYQAIRKIYGLAVVIMIPFFRYPLFLTLAVIMPAVQGVIMILTLGSKPIGLQFGIVNYELANWTADCDFMNNSENFCDLTALSCKYLKRLRNTDLIVLKSYDMEEDALNQVKLGNSWGYMIFPNNYSENTLNFAATKQYATNESIVGSRIHVHLDQAEYIASSLIIKHMYSSYLDYIKQLAISCQISEQEAVYPLHFRTPVYGDYEDNFVTFMMPGAILSSLFMLLGVLTSVLFNADYTQGTLSRARVAGLTTFDVMIGYLLTVGVLAVAQILVWGLAVYSLFDFVVAGSIWLCILICLLVAIASVAFGLASAVVFTNIVENAIFGVFTVPFILLYGGVFWPTESSRKLLQYFGYLIPNSLPTSSLRSVTIRGLGLTNDLVWPGILSILAWFFVLMMFSVIGYRRLCK